MKEKQLKKEVLTINRKLIFPLIFLLAALFSLIYIFKLKQDLKNNIQLLEEQKKEEIDYNKNAIFKDIEDEVPDSELQNFEEFKDVPEDSIQ